MRKKRKEFRTELADLETIEETVGLSGSQVDRKAWLLYENFKSLDQEEIYWYERSHGSFKGIIIHHFFIGVQMGGKGKIAF